MKKCPQCGRDFNDDSLSYCLDDGSELLFGPASMDEPQTALLHDSAPGASRDAARIQETGQTAVMPGGMSGTPSTRTFDKRMLLAPVALAVIVLGGFFGYRYFTAANSGTINSIAVLPFENRSNDPNADYLSDGLAESLIYRLSQLPDLKVSPTSSVMQYKGKGGNLVTIAKELGVRAVMTGKLVQRGDNLTVSIELVDVSNNKLLWGEQYERKMSDLLATQREIATAITHKLQLKLVGDEKGITKKYTNSNEAYQLYLKGRYYFARRTRDDVFKAIESYEQAIRLDPNFALAYAMLAEIYNQMPAYPYLPPQEAFPKAKSAATRALEIDPNLSEAHTALGNTLAAYEWNWAEAEREFKRAIELDPHSASAHFRYGQQYLGTVGRFKDAVDEMTRAVELEPLDVNMVASAAWWSTLAGQGDKALVLGQKAYELDPNHPVARNVLTQIYLHKGMNVEALQFIERSRQATPNRQWELQNLGIAYAKLGRRADAANVLSEFKTIARTQYVMSYYVATIYTALGDKDNAFAELENSLRGRDWRLLYIKGDPFIDPLRNDPRYRDVLRRMNLPE